MNDNEQGVRFGVAESQETMLSARMVRISKCDCKRIGEYCRGIMKRDTMLFPVRFRLFGIPLEFHSSIL
jgi:hypothetical protein